MTGSASSPIDDIDCEILAELQANARIAFAELGRRVGLSTPAVIERVKRLEESHILLGYRAIIDPARVGLPVRAFVKVTIAGDKLARFAALAKTLPEVLECHRVTGAESFMVQIAVRDVRHLEEVIDAMMPYVATNTSMILASPVPWNSILPGRPRRQTAAEAQARAEIAVRCERCKALRLLDLSPLNHHLEQSYSHFNDSFCKIPILDIVLPYLMAKNPEHRDLFPGALEMMILQSLRLRPMHGYALVRHIQQVSDDLLRVEEGSLYPALQRMLKEGWLDSEVGVSAKNRPTRIYRLTDAGVRHLRSEVSSFEKMFAGIHRVLAVRKA